MVTIRTEHGTLKGRSVRSIVRRTYGRAAVARLYPDGVGVLGAGVVLGAAPARPVLARIGWVEVA